MKLKARHKLFLFSVSVFLLGSGLLGPPKAIEEFFGFRETLGLFLLFVFWIFSLLAWGAFLDQQLGISKKAFELLPNILTGSAWAVIAAGYLGALGLVGEGTRLVPLGLLFCGPLLWAFAGSDEGFGQINFGSRQRTLLIQSPLLLVVGLFFLKAALPSQDYDALWYHLVGPRLWFQARRITLPAEYLIAYKTGSWENLYLWAQMLLGGSGSRGLVAAQIFSQWTHALMGLGGTALALYILTGNFVNDSRWRSLATLSAITGVVMIRGYAPTAYVAKNDWGAEFWFFGGLAILLQTQLPLRRRSLLAGVALGLSFTAKFTVAFTLFPIMLLLVALKFKKRGVDYSVGALGSGFLLGTHFILFRNYLGTGNPLYPTFTSVFGASGLGPTWLKNIQHLEGVSERINFQDFIFRLRSLSAEGLPVWVSFLSLPFLFFRRTGWPLKLVGLVAVSSFLLFALKSSARLELRLLGPGIAFWNVLGIATVAYSLSKWREIASPRLFLLTENSLLILCLALLMSRKNVLWKAPLELARAKPASEQLKNFVSGPPSEFLRSHLGPGEKIISMLGCRNYYLLPFGITRIWDYPDLDRSLSEAQDPLSMITTLRAHGYRFIYDDIFRIDDFYNARSVALLESTMQKFNEVMVFDSYVANIIDLEKFEAALKQQKNPGQIKPLAR